MTRRIYAMRDRLTGFMNPNIEDNDAVAMRSFERAILCEFRDDVGYEMDYSLWFIGYYRTEDGVITPVEPERLITGEEVLEKYGKS